MWLDFLNSTSKSLRREVTPLALIGATGFAWALYRRALMQLFKAVTLAMLVSQLLNPALGVASPVSSSLIHGESETTDEGDSANAAYSLSLPLIYIAVGGIGQTTQDSDNDGIPDSIDQCSNTSEGASVDATGCSEAQLDDDSDTVTNSNDLCPNTPSGATVDADGCSDSQKDDDGDGVANSTDLCANTPAGESVNAVGCSQSQTDSDGDGVSDDIDQCPNTSSGTDVDSSGCANAEAEVERVYIESVDPLIQAASCTLSGCHGRTLAPGGLVLRSLSTANATAQNYASMVDYIDSRGSTRLMNKIAGIGHGGQQQYSSSSSAYATIQAWARSVEALP